MKRAGFSAFSARSAGFALALVFVFAITTTVAAAGERDWIARSDRHAAELIDLIGAFSPEYASMLGAERFDAAVLDLRPRHVARFDAAAAKRLADLQRRRDAENDPRVQQDLDILLAALRQERSRGALEHRLLVPYRDLPKLIFQGLQVLLDERNSAARRQRAVERLRNYAGVAPGSRPLAELARERTQERATAKGLTWPYRGEVEQGIGNCDRHIAGIAELFAALGDADWRPAHVRLAGQLRDYCAWLRRTVLPRSRSTAPAPRELYEARLKDHGVAIDAEQAIALGSFGFAEIRDELARLAANFARERGLPSADYRDVLRHLKRDALPRDEVMARYRERLEAIERIVRRERLVTLPARPARMRLASDAEAAATPAPYFSPPRLIGNRGEVGEFVLPLARPGSAGGQPIDDYGADAMTWTWIAHEVRPGHDLQFSTMVERGVSLARAVFAFNSTNVEGWALYAESLLLPHLPPEGQLFSLQWRLVRAARAFLDPMVSLGRMTPEAARAFLVREAAVSETFAQNEADRYVFDLPGQNVSYFYGYSRLRALRLKAELRLGARFDAQRFHDLVLAQGLLPPDLLERAVLEQLSD